MKNKLQRCLTALMLGVILSLAAVPASAQEPLTELQGRYRAADELNELRTGMGLRTMTVVPELNDMARDHSAYMSQNKTLSPLEKPQNAGFTGISVLDRMGYSGYDGQFALELRLLGEEDYNAVIRQALRDPYQRFMLLHPSADGIGFGMEKEYCAIVLGGRDYAAGNDTLVSYPYAGQQEVGNCALRLLTQVPDEVRESSSRYQIGEPVTVSYYTSAYDELEFHNVRVTLTDTKKSRQVPVYCQLPQDNPPLGQTMILYPLELYNTDTRYEVELFFQVFAGKEKLADIQQNWSYTSSGPDSIGEVSRVEALGTLGRMFGLSQEALPQEPDLQFTDYAYDSSHPQSVMVYRLLEEDILNLKTDGQELEAAEGTTREQMAIWMMKMLRKYQKTLYYSVHLDYEDTFEDINKCSAEGKIAVQRAYLMGLVQDQGGGRFSPDVFITRTEFEAWLAALQELLSAAVEAVE